MSNYAKAFRIFRAAMDLSQGELAARIGITSSHLSLIEAGKRQPSFRTIEMLAQAAGTAPPMLVTLACSPKELDEMGAPQVGALADVLLRLLVSA